MTRLNPDAKREVENLMFKWDITYNEALGVFLGTRTIEAVLRKHNRRPDSRIVFKTLDDRRPRFDAMSKRLPGSFENPQS